MKSNTFKLAARAVCVCAAVAMLVACAATSAFAQTTGQIIGTVGDAPGGGLPDVSARWRVLVRGTTAVVRAQRPHGYGAEREAVIGGIDATGIDRGQQQKTLLMDFIDQVNIKSEGANAEYGGYTGGMIEAITK